MQDVNQKRRNAGPFQFGPLEPVPGLVVRGRVESVEIRLIPALSAIAGSKAGNSQPSNNNYAPPRALYLSKNEDGTFAILNRLELVEPDIARITAIWVTAYVIQLSPDQKEQESLLRTFLTIVEPARYCVTGPQLLYEIFKGKLDKLASYYASARCKLGSWGMYEKLFSNNELPKSTFYSHKSSPDGKMSSSSSGSTEPAATDDNETPLPEVDKKPQRQKAEKQPKGNQRDFFDKLD